jgi:hypothetical protein
VSRRPRGRVSRNRPFSRSGRPVADRSRQKCRSKSARSLRSLASCRWCCASTDLFPVRVGLRPTTHGKNDDQKVLAHSVRSRPAAGAVPRRLRDRAASLRDRTARHSTASATATILPNRFALLAASPLASRLFHSVEPRSARGIAAHVAHPSRAGHAHTRFALRAPTAVGTWTGGSARISSNLPEVLQRVVERLRGDRE